MKTEILQVQKDLYKIYDVYWDNKNKNVILRYKNKQFKHPNCNLIQQRCCSTTSKLLFAHESSHIKSKISIRNYRDLVHNIILNTLSNEYEQIRILVIKKSVWIKCDDHYKQITYI